MSDQGVSFEEQFPSMQSAVAADEKQVSGMAQWLIKQKIVKTAREANLLLVAVILIGLGGAVYFTFF